MGVVGVASCAHWAWIESSKIMGDNLAGAIGDGVVSRVHTPIDSKGLIACLEQSNYFIIHTHGSPSAFINELADGSQKQIASLNMVKKFPKFPKLKLVVMTACQTANNENGNENIAMALSRQIASDGLVFANRYATYGSNCDFGERYGKPGWVAYQNGAIVLTEKDIPPRITTADAFRIFLDYRKKH